MEKRPHALIDLDPEPYPSPPRSPTIAGDGEEEGGVPLPPRPRRARAHGVRLLRHGVRLLGGVARAQNLPRLAQRHRLHLVSVHVLRLLLRRHLHRPRGRPLFVCPRNRRPPKGSIVGWIGFDCCLWSGIDCFLV